MATNAPVAAKTRRFTTVDEEAARRAREQPTQVWLVAAQLAGMAAALLGLFALGWWLTRPASADDLYKRIESHIAEQGEDDLNSIEDEIGEFLERFPSDERSANLRPYADELELRRMERRIRFQSRVAGKQESHPVAELFGQANALRESDPERAAEILEDLLTLYPSQGAASVAMSDDMRQYLTLAERELAKLEKAIAAKAKEQLPPLRDRLLAAERLEETNPQEAASMYRALIDLYGRQPWAAELVDEARSRLSEIEN